MTRKLTLFIALIFVFLHTETALSVEVTIDGDQAINQTELTCKQKMKVLPLDISWHCINICERTVDFIRMPEGWSIIMLTSGIIGFLPWILPYIFESTETSNIVKISVDGVVVLTDVFLVWIRNRRGTGLFANSKTACRTKRAELIDDLTLEE